MKWDTDLCVREVKHPASDRISTGYECALQSTVTASYTPGCFVDISWSEAPGDFARHGSICRNEPVRSYDPLGLKWEIAGVGRFIGTSSDAFVGKCRRTSRTDTLRDLAELVTGNANDAPANDDGSDIVDVSDLLRKLDERVRDRVVELTDIWSQMGWGLGPTYVNYGPNEAASISAWFDPKNKGRFIPPDCRLAVTLIMSKAVLDVMLEKSEWQRLGYSTYFFERPWFAGAKQMAGQRMLVRQKIAGPEALRRGDWGYVLGWQKRTATGVFPVSGFSGGENIVSKGQKAYWGPSSGGGRIATLDEWAQMLWNETPSRIDNPDAGKFIWGGGFVPGDTTFIDIGRVATEVFNSRARRKYERVSQ